MSIAIHHGPGGSYKSFTLVQRRAIEGLKEGRTVVTNIRGFDDIELVKQTFSDFDFPDTANIISVDTRTIDGKLLLAKWFHWVPFGSLVLIDEAQSIYPMRKEFKIQSLDEFENTYGLNIQDIFGGESRPATFELAFDMHRHFNWDLFLSTPNIAKINKEIRQAAEWAYRHRDISALLPWYKNKWVESQHDPEFSGKSLSHVVGVPVKYQANLDIFKCYSSTATGQHKGSEAGRSIFKDPKILSIIIVICLCITLFFFLLFSKTSEASLQEPQISKKNHSLSTKKDITKVVSRATRFDNSFKTSNTIDINPPAPHSAGKRWGAGDLIQYDFLGVPKNDFSLLPDSCRFGRRFVHCGVSFEMRLRYKNTWCEGDSCTVLLAYRRESYKVDLKKQGGYRPLSF